MYNETEQKWLKSGTPVQYVDTKQEAEVFITDENGKIKISNLSKKGTYLIYEVVNPYFGYEEVSINQPKLIDTVEISALGANAERTIENKRTYIRISGYAWEDKISEKMSVRNWLWKNDSNDTEDRGVNNIKVTLKKADGTIIDTTTTITDSNNQEGAYVLGDYISNENAKKIEITDLEGAYIEFEYNGMSYKSVEVKADVDNGNKATDDALRNNFNESYATVVNGEAQNGIGQKTYDLTYDFDNHVSTLNYGGKYLYGYDGQKYPISGIEEQYMITASTKAASPDKLLGQNITINDILSKGIEEIPNVNLGLWEREMPDLSVVKDLESAKVSINGKDHIYKYGDRFKNIVTNEDYTMDPTVKFGQKRGNESYTRALYASDIKYTGENELEVKVTYKIGIRNNSTNLTAIVNELNDYYDVKYDEIAVGAVGTEIETDGSIKAGTELKCSSDGNAGSEYTKIKINTDSLNIEKQSEKYVYVELTVKPECIDNIIDRGEDVKLDNVTEIASYSIQDNNGKTYAGIDIDSQPGNLDPNDVNTYEDDTDKAPGLLIVLQEARSTEGKVFLDSTSGELMTGQVRQGNGILDDGESGISNVKVTLLKENGENEETAQVYDEGTGQWVDAITKTDDDGNYKISGYIPGEYKIMYTWGDGTYKVQDYKSTIVDEASYTAKGNQENQNEQWYKEEFKKEYLAEWNTTTNTEIRRSDAVDDYELRKTIDSQVTEVTNKTKNSDVDKDGNPIIKEINSYTPVFEALVEYQTGKTETSDEFEVDEDNTLKRDEDGRLIPKDSFKNRITSIDFGIVLRAKQVLELDKRVTNVKVTLANGMTVINANIKEDGTFENEVKYATYMPKSLESNGTVKIEMDDEIIQGSTLEVKYEFKVTNISEVEYLNQNFYLYGSGHGEEEGDIVKLTASNIIDYLDNSLVVDLVNLNEDWENIDKNSAKELLDSSADMGNYLNGVNQVIKSENSSSLIPVDGKNTSRITLELSKLLSNSQDEMCFDNDTEIVKVEKTGGSTLMTTPGNYIPGKSGHEYDDSQAESVVITPPTGLNNNIISWTLLAISCCGILVSGILLIKKYVLKN